VGERPLPVAKRFQDGEREQQLDEGRVVVAVDEGAEGIGISGREEPEDLAARSEILRGGQDAYGEAEVEQRAEKGTPHRIFVERLEREEDHHEKSAPEQHGFPGIEAVNGRAKEELEQSPGKHTGKGQKQIAASEA
jgi:hypothetical protein